MKQPMTRKEKEALYIQITSKLIRGWNRKVHDSDFGDFSNWTDEELEATLKIAQEQRRFERGYAIFAILASIGIVMLLSYLF